MESIYTELALYGSKHKCARTDTVFLTISEVCDGTVSLEKKVFPVIARSCLETSLSLTDLV